MSFGDFLENLSGFLFRPSKMTEENMKQEGATMTPKMSHMFILYLALLLGVSIWFLVLYPEPLYYGLYYPTAYRNIYSLDMSIPLYLLLIILVSLIIIYGINFLVIGIFNYRFLKRYNSRGTEEPLKVHKYLTIFAFSFSPLLFSVPVITVFIFFFEKLWLDLNIPTMLLFLTFGFLLIWQGIIELKINKISFRISVYKAAIPIFIRFTILIILVIMFVYLYPIILAYMIANFGGVG